MAMILHIETTADFCSISISKANTLLVTRETDEQYAHSSKITILIQECLKEANLSLKELDAVALSQGPGSYTGLRVGTSTAKGICYALDKPLIAVNTLQALALATCQTVQDPDAFYVPMIDARRMEVYTATFNFQNEFVTEIEAHILDENSFQNHLKNGQKLVFSGNGAPKSKPLFDNPIVTFSEVLPKAPNMVSLAYHSFQHNDFQDLAYFSPLYFKSPNITSSKKNIL